MWSLTRPDISQCWPCNEHGCRHQRAASSASSISSKGRRRRSSLNWSTAPRRSSSKAGRRRRAATRLRAIRPWGNPYAIAYGLIGSVLARSATHGAGHYRSVAACAQSWPRRAAERQVSGDETGPVFGLTRPSAASGDSQLSGISSRRPCLRSKRVVVTGGVGRKSPRCTWATQPTECEANCIPEFDRPLTEKCLANLNQGVDRCHIVAGINRAQLAPGSLRRHRPSIPSAPPSPCR